MPIPKISVTTDDLTPALDAIFESMIPAELRAQIDKNREREIKQDILDGLWPGLEEILNIANVNVSAAAEVIWAEGYASGHSRAMRKMSDEPSVADSHNPYTPR